MALFRDEADADQVFSLDSVDTPQSRRVNTSRLVELRGSPRVEVSFPVEVCMAGAHCTLAMITNISRSGLRVEGGTELCDVLFNGEILQHDHVSRLAQFRFTVTGDSGDRTVVVQGRTVYTRQDAGGYQCGVEFIEFSDGRDALLDYLASRGVHS